MANVSTGAKTLRHIWQSPWTSWVGLRYLRSKKHSRFLSFITTISIAGVALGVCAMVVVLSVMDGFEEELKKRLMATDLHVLVTPSEQAIGYDHGFVPETSFSNDALQAVRSDSRVDQIWPMVTTEAILRSRRKVAGVLVKGVSPERMERLQAQVTESASEPMLKHDGVRVPGLFLGQELAFELGVLPGDEVSLISPTETEGPLDSIPRLKKYIVEGIFKSGLPEQEMHTVFTTAGTVRSFIRRANVLNQWEVTVHGFDESPEVAQKIRGLVPDFKVQDWMQLNSHLFYSLKLERVAMGVILAFIVVVASFNIVTTLTLMVLEKKREISILKAMGARDGEVGAIFLAEGLFIGGLGVLGGVVLGFSICVALRRYEFIKLPDVYLDTTLPVSFRPDYYLLIVGCALLIVVAACLYPSKRAAQVHPLDGIRFG